MIMAQQHLSRVWFLSRGFKQVPLEETNGKVLYAHPDGYFVNQQGKRLYVCPFRCKSNKHSHGGVYPTMRNHAHKYCHVLMAVTFLRKPQEGEQVDHINGNNSDFALSNLRIVPKEINDRDGGFLRKLRNKGINPTYYSAPFLLRFFDRMAEYKCTRTHYQYARLTHDELLTMLVGPEFTMGDPAKIMEEEMTRHREW
jgi:hypothetical protein